MKSIIVTSMLVLTSLVCFGQTGTIILIVEGAQVKKGGELSAGVFTQKEFPKIGRQLVGQEVKVDASTMTIIFKDLPVGSYGIAVFQDVDVDKDLKTNIVGLPQEPIGFSNDARIKFGPPDFDDARFTVISGQETKLKIVLR